MDVLSDLASASTDKCRQGLNKYRLSSRTWPELEQRLKEARTQIRFRFNKIYSLVNYWLNYWHILISKGTNGFTSNTLYVCMSSVSQYFILKETVIIGLNSKEVQKLRAEVDVYYPLTKRRTDLGTLVVPLVHINSVTCKYVFH